MECYDAIGDAPGAIGQLLRQIDFDRYNLALYASLARRAQQDESLAERAATSIVEAAPQETEHYQELARLRQEQDRWPEAIPLWRRASELHQSVPSGLLGLAAAQIHERQWPAARETLARLRERDWPAGFGDIEQHVRGLEAKLPPERQ
jgi:tetratricopeptide (TPR) repeat protein